MSNAECTHEITVSSRTGTFFHLILLPEKMLKAAGGEGYQKKAFLPQSSSGDPLPMGHKHLQSHKGEGALLSAHNWGFYFW